MKPSHAPIHTSRGTSSDISQHPGGTLGSHADTRVHRRRAAARYGVLGHRPVGERNMLAVARDRSGRPSPGPRFGQRARHVTDRIYQPAHARRAEPRQPRGRAPRRASARYYCPRARSATTHQVLPAGFTPECATSSRVGAAGQEEGDMTARAAAGRDRPPGRQAAAAARQRYPG